MTNTIDLDALVQSVRDIAAENPDFVYQTVEGACFYERDGEPSCIVGQALAQQGVTIEELREYDDTVASGISHVLARHYDVNPETVPQAMWLALVQRRQDQGGTWALAVETADSQVSL